MSQAAPLDDFFEKMRDLGDRGQHAAAARLGTHTLSHPAWAEAPAALRSRFLQNLAFQYSALGAAERAFDYLDRAFACDPAQQGEVAGGRGLALQKVGRFEDAVREFSFAVESLTLGRPLFAALMNRGNLFMTLSRVRSAEADIHRAVAVAERLGSTRLAHMARHNLGYARFLAGDLPGALRSMQAAEKLAEPSGVPALDRARVLLAAGLLTEAREYADIAAGLFTDNRSRLDLAEALQVGAEIELRSGDPAAAHAKANAARRLFTRLRNTPAALVAQLLGLRARWNDAAGHPLTAGDVRRAHELSDRLTAVGLSGEAATARLLVVEALLATRQVSTARGELAGLGGNRGHPLELRLHRRLLTARVALAGPDRPQAQTHLRRGLDELAEFQARFGSQDLQAGAAIHGRELGRLGLRTAVESGSPAAILHWLERARAVTTRLPVISPPADAELAELLGALRIATNDARTATLAGQPDPALRRRVAELQQQVRARTWTVAGSGRAARPISLAETQRRLAGDPAAPTIVALLTGDEQVHALVIDRHRAAFRTLAPWTEGSDSYRRLIADLDLLAAPRVPEPVRKVARCSLDTALDRLSHDLLDPVRGRLGAGPIRLVAVGELATVPWSMIPGLRGRPVSVHSSVTTAMQDAVPPEPTLLAVAGPDVPDGPAEVHEIAQRYSQATVLTAADATGSAVLQHLPGGGILHIAAHGRHERDNPLFSSVELADGPLFGYDLAPARRQPAQVILSSCDVGQSHLRPGGEPLGLAAALLRSGVSTVIAGIARVSDSIARPVMVDYHRRLLAGADAATALSQAVLVADGEPVPFTCFGGR